MLQNKTKTYLHHEHPRLCQVWCISLSALPYLSICLLFYCHSANMTHTRRVIPGNTALLYNHDISGFSEDLH